MLITSKRFLPLFITQFLGAFNDNLFKNALIILIMYRLSDSGHDAQILVTIAAGVFILPFFIFSALAGQLADKYDRALIAKLVKIFEIIIMAFACVGFYVHDAWFLIGILFALGIHSTFFGPVKYALLPQHLYPNELLLGNAYIEAGTFLAILFGTICGGIMIIQDNGELIVSIGLLFAAVAGLISACLIPVSPAPVPKLVIKYNLYTETLRLIRYSRMQRKILIIIFCISWFWFIGAIFLAQLATYVKNYLHAEAQVVTLFLTIFSVGIAIGSFACSRLLRGAIKTTYVPLACFGMSLFILDLYLSSTNKIFYDLHGLLSWQRFLHLSISWRIMFDLLLVAICGGIYIVPLYTMLQHNTDKNYLARVIATNNIFNALFMVLATLFTLGMLALSKSILDVFLTMGLINFIVGVYIRKLLNSHLD